MQQHPLDQVGPLRSQGPTPAECEPANEKMDIDEGFEAQGAELLGGDLMGEVGSRRATFVPEWLGQKRQMKEMASNQHYEYRGEASTS
jgi:hypothetical protein